ncbi:MAG: SDR family oxidoreductase [Candidatus Neomarinimicrobiota bacterium]
MNLLRGKTALITGSGRGIGKATAELFSAEGARVIIAEYDKTTGQAAADEIGGVFYQVDVSQSKSVINLFKEVNNNFDQLDILVNNAGILADSTLKKMEEGEFERIINVNLKGVFLCTKYAAEIMQEQGFGVILNASSVVAHYGNFGQTNYVASKTGVIGMTRVWARELGRKGIRVNAVAPGFINTEMTAQMPEKIVRLMGEKVPLKRWGEASEVANVYCFLASDMASYINGAVINVDGGVVV